LRGALLLGSDGSVETPIIPGQRAPLLISPSTARPLRGGSRLKRSIANFVAADLTGLTRIIKHKLKKIQYRPELINGCLTETGLTIELTKIEKAETTSST
ncbi:hypothetical protein OS965_42305, partial [Streptomyces sp. H27-G5]|nr:hypothetical protein [Streptomyces sp. H27-G5]